jgi:nitrogen fixation NifU-like protein
MDGFYTKSLLDHYRNPRNFGHLERPDATAQEENVVCGDDIRVELAIDRDFVVTEVRFSGSGCAISQASTSMLTEHVQGKPLHEVASLQKEAVLENIGMVISSPRLRCALLGLEVLRTAARSRLV